MRSLVLFVCEGAQHLANGRLLARALGNAGIRSCLYYPHELTPDVDVGVFDFVMNDIFAVPGFLRDVGLVVFFTHESSPYCMVSNKIGFIAKETGASCMTIQHGWIQPGFNFRTPIKRVAFKGRDTDNSRAISHFSKVVSFFGDDGIGFPPLNAKQKRIGIDKRTEYNVLLATNFNWGVYSRENIVAFMRCVQQLGSAFPSLLIAHKAHSAEKSQNITGELGFYLDSLGVVSREWPSIESALAWADIVISTPSTVVLDAMSKNTPVFVFSTERFTSALEDMRSISFSLPSDLVGKIGHLLADNVYECPELKPFDSEKFVRIIRDGLARSKPYSLDEEAFLRYCMYAKA